MVSRYQGMDPAQPRAREIKAALPNFWRLELRGLTKPLKTSFSIERLERSTSGPSKQPPTLRLSSYNSNTGEIQFDVSLFSLLHLRGPEKAQPPFSPAGWELDQTQGHQSFLYLNIKNSGWLNILVTKISVFWMTVCFISTSLKCLVFTLCWNWPPWVFTHWF